MKIIHTADIHLTGRKDRFHKVRWNALNRIIALANEKGAGLVLIAGDLFDSVKAADELRNEVRGVFEKLKGRVVIIPGNHDAEAFSSGNYYGKNVGVITDLFEPFYEDGFPVVWGVPFTGKRPEELLFDLRSVAKKVIQSGNSRNAILLFHGELLDISGEWSSYGDEGQRRYLPVKLHYFEKLPWRYILAGHFHTNYSINTFGKDGFFVYPGSPVSVTLKEIGRRKINIFEPGGKPEEVPIETFHYEEINVELSPFDSMNPLEKIIESLKNSEMNTARIVNVKGYFNGAQWKITEKDLANRLESMRGKLDVDVINSKFLDIGKILSDDIYSLFKERLKESDFKENEKREIENIFIEAMMGVPL